MARGQSADLRRFPAPASRDSRPRGARAATGTEPSRRETCAGSACARGHASAGRSTGPRSDGGPSRGPTLRVRVGAQPGDRACLGARVREEEQPAAVAPGRTGILGVHFGGADESALPGGLRGDPSAHSEHQETAGSQPATGAVGAARAPVGDESRQLRRRVSALSTGTAGASAP